MSVPLPPATGDPWIDEYLGFRTWLREAARTDAEIIGFALEMSERLPGRVPRPGASSAFIDTDIAITFPQRAGLLLRIWA